MILGKPFDQAIRIAAPPLIQANSRSSKKNNTATFKTCSDRKSGTLFSSTAHLCLAALHSARRSTANPMLGLKIVAWLRG